MSQITVTLPDGSTRTVPVDQSAGPLLEGCEPESLMSMGQIVIRGTAGQ